MKIAQSKVLVTGGAGFIGSRLVSSLLEAGAKSILVLDNLHPQVHGEGASFPTSCREAECVIGDICDSSLVSQVVEAYDPDIVVHLASETGTGQSLDEIQRYTAVNVQGMANILAAIGRLPKRPRDFFLSSSRSVYGEGPYEDSSGTRSYPPPRSYDDLTNGHFFFGASASTSLKPSASNPFTRESPLSVYASTKLMQEYLLKNTCESYCITPKILRFQNVYGPGQSLRNPYTGVLSIFSAQVLSGVKLNIFEDGAMVRDFVYVDDVVRAILAALKHDRALIGLDVGSGEPTTILKAAQILLAYLGAPPNFYRISGAFRAGDIRSAYSDISFIYNELGWVPQVSLKAGLHNLADWAKSQHEQARPHQSNS